MEFTEEKNGDALILGLKGKLDVGTSDSFEAKIKELVQMETEKIILDLSKLAYISSSGFKILLLAGKRVRTAGGNLVLSSLSDHLRQLFEVTGFSVLFPIYEDVDAAQCTRASEGENRE